MNYTRSKITRRAMMLTLGAFTSMGPTRQNIAEEKSSATMFDKKKTILQIDREYHRLLPLWLDEQKQFSISSNTHAYWSGPNGKAIIALGPAVIPYLIRQLREENFFSTFHLRKLRALIFQTEKIYQNRKYQSFG